jgi:hypothetical protein
VTFESRERFEEWLEIKYQEQEATQESGTKT